MATVYLPYYHDHDSESDVPAFVLGIFTTLTLAKEEAERMLTHPHDECVIKAYELNTLHTTGGRYLCSWYEQQWDHRFGESA